MKNNTVSITSIDCSNLSKVTCKPILSGDKLADFASKRKKQAKKQAENKQLETVKKPVVDTKTRNFKSLIVAYNDDQSSENLISIAQACTYSVLNKIYSASGNKNILNIKAQVASGEDTTLVDTAVVAILEETSSQLERDGSIDLEREYIKRVPEKRVYIQETPDDVFVDKTTTPIQEVYKAVRREINNAGSVKTDCNGYSYESLTVYDTESDAGEIIYKRYHKYADIGGYVKDYNGADTVYTASGDADRVYELIESMNLTARQAQVIKYRLSGYGYKAIATKLGCSVSTVRTQLKLIQDKAKTIGLTLDK